VYLTANGWTAAAETAAPETYSMWWRAGRKDHAERVAVLWNQRRQAAAEKLHDRLTERRPRRYKLAAWPANVRESPFSDVTGTNGNGASDADSAGVSGGADGCCVRPDVVGDGRSDLANRPDGGSAMNDKLAAAQAEFGPIRFDAENAHFGSRYATLQAILAVVRPVLNRHGIALMQHVSTRETRVRIRTELRHGTDAISSTLAWTLPADTTPQKLAGACTYLKRIALQGILGIAGEDDDDGNSISQPPQSAASRSSRRSARSEPAPPAAASVSASGAGGGDAEVVTEGRCTEHKHGTTKAGKEWILATVVDLSSGEAFKIGSFSRTAIDALRTTSGTDQVWRIRHKPGKSDDTRDLVRIDPVDAAGEVALRGIPF